MANITYNCSRCRQPLTLRSTSTSSDSLLTSSVRESGYDLLASHIAEAAGKQVTQSAEDKAFQAQARILNVPLLPRKVVAVPKQHGAAKQARQALFDKLSSQSDIDFPLCSDCAEAWIIHLNEANEGRKSERDRLLAFESDVRSKRDEYASQDARLKAETLKLEMEEKQLTVDLLEAEREKDILDAMIQTLQKEEEDLQQEEKAFWLEYNRYQADSQRHAEASRSLVHSYDNALSVLDRLQKTNVYADAFFIGQDGGVPTINGLRFGRLPSVAVDWSEINAAWGCTVLLMKTIARKISLDFTGYRLVPMGSFSRIEKLSTQSSRIRALELHGSGDWALGRLLQNRRFDEAMVAFLECLRQLMEFMEDRANDRGTELRGLHLVSEDKIGNVSIRLGKSDEAWTMALKYVLVNLRLLLAEAVK